MNNNLNSPNTNAANTRDIRELFSKTAYDVNGDKLGGINEVFVDGNTGEPTFVDVNHRLVGAGHGGVHGGAARDGEVRDGDARGGIGKQEGESLAASEEHIEADVDGVKRS